MHTSWASSTSWWKKRPAARTGTRTRPPGTCARRCGGTCATSASWVPTRSSRTATASSASSAPSPSPHPPRSVEWRRSLLLLQVPSYHGDELVGFHEAAVPVVVRREQLLLLHLLDGLSALQPARDQRDDLVEAVPVLLEVGDRLQRAVSGDDLRVGRDLRQHLVDRPDEAAH